MKREDLHPYQHKAIDTICSKRRCALWLDMGLGKTVSTLTALSDLIDASMVKKVLIVAPLRVANSVWKQEALKWDHLSHLKVSVTTGTAQERREALNAKADIYVINRENVPWLVELCAKAKRWPFDTIVIDESSSFKNPSSKRFRALKKLAHLAHYFIELSGTPSPNSLMDLWSQIFLLDKGASLGKTITGFRQRFFTPDYWGHSWTIKAGAEPKIHNLIKHLALSMQAEDYLDVPEKIEMIETVLLPDPVKAKYYDFESTLFMDLGDKEVEAMSAAVLANKLLQMASGAIYVDEEHNWQPIHNRKLDTLSEIIDENPSENIMIAYNYKHSLARLQEKLPSAVVLGKDPEVIDRWNKGEIKLLLVHPQSAGHGLNLQQGGSMLVWFDLTWSLEAFKQTCARLHRQGQIKPVRIIYLISEGTIDERVLKVLRNKDAVQNDLLTALR